MPKLQHSKIVRLLCLDFAFICILVLCTMLHKNCYSTWVKAHNDLHISDVLSLWFIFTDDKIPESPEAHIKLAENVLKQSTGRLNADILDTSTEVAHSYHSFPQDHFNLTLHVYYGTNNALQ